MTRFTPTPDDRLVALLAVSRQALDAAEAVARKEGGLPGWVEARLRSALLELRYVSAYADSRLTPPLPSFQPSEHSEKKA